MKYEKREGKERGGRFSGFDNRKKFPKKLCTIYKKLQSLDPLHGKLLSLRSLRPFKSWIRPAAPKICQNALALADGALPPGQTTMGELTMLPKSPNRLKIGITYLTPSALQAPRPSALITLHDRQPKQVTVRAIGLQQASHSNTWYLNHSVCQYVVVSLKMWGRKCALFLLEALCDSEIC